MKIWSIAVAWLVGLLWGITNPLVKKGSEAAGHLHGKKNSIFAHLKTPSFIIPQLINQSGSILFILLLGQESADLSRVATLSNAVNLGSTALAEIALGESFQLQYLIPGLFLLLIGVVLCS